MQYRTLGLTAIQVSTIALGRWPFAAPASWGPQDEAASVATVHSEIDAGITSIDNAAGYGGGQAERIVAKGLGARPTDVVLCTKARGDQLTANTLPETCEQSLKDICTELYRPVPNPLAQPATRRNPIGPRETQTARQDPRLWL